MSCFVGLARARASQCSAWKQSSHFGHSTSHLTACWNPAGPSISYANCANYPPAHVLAQGGWEHLCLPMRFERGRMPTTCLG
jgi:hypothetical protein